MLHPKQAELLTPETHERLLKRYHAVPRNGQ
jgi:hypothetical protein